MTALQRFRTLVEQSVDVIMLVGPTGELLYASQAASSVLGYAPGENLGRATFELVHPDDLDQVHTLFRDLLTRSPGPARAEFRVRHKEGSWRYLEATGINRLDEPAVEAIVVTYRDVTDRRQAEDAQRAAYWIAEAVLSTYSLDELFSSIHRILGDLMPVPNLYIALYDATGDTLTFPYFVDERESAPPPRRLNHGLTEYVLRTGQPELVGPDRQRELEQRGEVDLLGAASLDWLGIPLKSGANTIGVLVIQSYTESIRFGEREKRILQFVSAEVAVAIERRRAEESLRATQSLLQSVLDNAPIVLWAVNKEGILTMARGRALQEASLGSRYVVGQSALEAHRGIMVLDGAGHESNGGESIGRALAGEAVSGVSEVEGTYLENVLTPMRSPTGEISGMVGVSLVVSEQKRLEEQLRQSQKMEAIGRFAAGIAHDFNNILTAITGYAGLLLDDLHSADPRRDDVLEIQQAALRAAGLTRQLLAFSRKQVLEPRVLRLSAVVDNLLPMLRRLIGEDVALIARAAPELGAISADPGQLEQVLLNLVVNSRDAMPEGGELTIETRDVEVTEPWHQGKCVVPPGRYALLAVSDTGSGMTAAVQARIFEPFFTTKPQGKGTGLGLSTVYGIVKQSGGFLGVSSEPGRGTCISAYFPRVEAPVEPSLASGTLTTSPLGSETVLVVEDQQTVRALTCRVLEESGYRVLVAADGNEALRVSSTYPGPIHLLVSDVIMPGMSGREVGLLLSSVRPEMRSLYLSGYPDESIVHHGVLEPGVAFLQKPFAPEVLARRVREELDR